MKPLEFFFNLAIQIKQVRKRNEPRVTAANLRAARNGRKLNNPTAPQLRFGVHSNEENPGAIPEEIRDAADVTLRIDSGAAKVHGWKRGGDPKYALGAIFSQFVEADLLIHGQGSSIYRHLLRLHGDPNNCGKQMKNNPKLHNQQICVDVCLLFLFCKSIANSNIVPVANLACAMQAFEAAHTIGRIICMDFSLHNIIPPTIGKVPPIMRKIPPTIGKIYSIIYQYQ